MCLSHEFFIQRTEESERFLKKGYKCFEEMMEEENYTIEDLYRCGVFIYKNWFTTASLYCHEPHPDLKYLFRVTALENIMIHPRNLRKVCRIFKRLDQTLPTGKSYLEVYPEDGKGAGIGNP